MIEIGSKKREIQQTETELKGHRTKFRIVIQSLEAKSGKTRKMRQSKRMNRWKSSKMIQSWEMKRRKSSKVRQSKRVNKKIQAR